MGEHGLQRVVPALVLVAVLAGTVGTTSAVADDWHALDGAATGEFRTGRLDGGTYVWTNGVYQSRGANTDGLHHEDYWSAVVAGGELPIDERDDVENHLTWGAFGVDRWATDGDQELPRDDAAWPEFTGEVNELRLAVDDDELFVRWRFTSMPTDETQIATLTLGDGPDATWPHGAGVTAPWEVAVTAWGTGGSLSRNGEEPVPLDAGAVRVTDHDLEVRVPLAALPEGPWSLRGGAGLTDPADRTKYWAVPAGSATDTAPGSGSSLRDGSPVWSLLFATEDEWVFTARAEGDLLADGDVTAATVTVDPDDLDAGRTTAPSETGGRLSRQYSSAHDFGDGIAKGTPEDLPAFLMVPPEVPLDDAARSFEYLGGVQPYGMVVPAAYHERAEPWPLVVYLHGLNNFYYEPFGLVQGLDEMLAERGYLFAGLLGRGDLSYLGRGELDVREAIADIVAHYDVDPDRIHLMGHSMGSIGTHNVVTRNPDRFASASPAQITASDDLLVNLRHVPWMTSGGIEDPLDPFAQSELDTHTALSDLGYDATTYLFGAKTHENSSVYDLLPQTFDLFDRTRRVTTPGTFAFRRLPGDDHPEIGIVHDRAYAASELVFADDTRPQQVGVTSFAIPHAPLDPANAERSDELVDEGGRSVRTAARKLVTVPAFGPDHEVRNAAEVTLDNVGGITLDLDRLDLDPVVGLEFAVATADAVVLRLTGVVADGVVAELDDEVVADAVTKTGIEVAVPDGDHVLRLVAAPVDNPAGGGSPAPGTPPRAQAPTAVASPTAAPPLPATGGGVAAAVLAVALVSTRRRRFSPGAEH